MSMSRHDVAAYAAGQRRRRGRKSASAILTSLGLSARFILDMADSASLPIATAQTVLDTSGNGQDFFRGADATSSATDPTLVGSPGSKSRSTYLLFDGGDYLTLDEANPVWVNNIHKDDATFSAALWVQFGSTGTVNGILGTRGNTTATIGFLVIKTALEKLSFLVGNGSGAAIAATTAAGFVTGWNFIGIRQSEAVGANGLVLQINATQELFTSTYATPSAAAAVSVLKIGAFGSGGTPLSAGSRVGMAMATDAVWTPADLMGIYNATKSRYTA